LLRNKTNDLTKNEARAADALLANYPLAGLQPIARFAAEAGVSAQTVLRLIAKLGCTGYGAFQEQLREELSTVLQSPRGRLLVHEVGETASPDFIGAFRDQLTRDIKATLGNLKRPELDKATALLADAKQEILILGGRLTQSMAAHMATHLRAMRHRVTLLAGESAAWPDALIDVGRRTTIVAFDVRRYQKDVVNFCTLAAKRGGRIILMTDNADAPIAKSAGLVLVAQTSSLSAWDSFIGLLALSELLIAGVSDRLGQRLRTRMTALDAARDRFFGDASDPPAQKKRRR
jgi:DNA-binding MurR/RpiR family transcriptional regulator